MEETPPNKRPHFFRQPLNWFLFAIPVAVYLRFTGGNELAMFAFSCLSIVPLAGLMGRATESLGETMGPGASGLLNATFGNAAELIIAIMAIVHGPEMYPLVKASITGSIIGNILLVLGLSVFVGGIYHPRQQVNPTAAHLGVSLLAIATAGLVIPSLYVFAIQADNVLAEMPNRVVTSLSEEIAVVLAGVYILSLVFSLVTHRHLFDEPVNGEGEGEAGEKPEPEWGVRKAMSVLVAATVGVAFMSELLVHSVEAAGKSLGMTEVFVGVIVVAIVGNAAEHSTAVMMAIKNKMDLAFNISVGSSIQVSLFVAPVLVFVSWALGEPIDLHFSIMEVMAIILSIIVLTLVCHDGETHWIEGAMLLALYFILALAFYHLPPSAVSATKIDASL